MGSFTGKSFGGAFVRRLRAVGSPAEERFTQRADEEKAHKAKEEATWRAAEEVERGMLQQLLDAYVGRLEKQGKQSAPDVRSIFNIHVLAAASDIAAAKHPTSRSMTS
jgi:hypothetical protein